MCGRLDFSDSPILDAFFERHSFPMFESSTNIAPTETVPVIIQLEQIELHKMQWWLTPSWVPEPSQAFSMFNAHAENITSSKAFRNPFSRRRCLIPVSGYYEWQKVGKSKIPYRISSSTSPLLLAGVWDTWEKNGSYLESCAIITTESVSELSWLHTRQPVIIPEIQLNEWLNPRTPLVELGKYLLPHLPFDLEAVQVNQAVGNSRYKGLVDPIGEIIQIKN